MTTLAQIRQRCLELEPSLGRTVSITSLAAQAVTVTGLAVGTIGARKYTNKWLLRPDASTAADRLRFSQDFNSNNGQINHEGAAYSDTTATSESLEIHEHEPYLMDLAVQQTLRTTRFLDRSILPSNLSGEYWLNALSWIVDPSDITRVGWAASPVATRNRHMEKWNGVSSGGLLVPDDWTLGGTSATFARVASARLGAYSLALTSTGSGTATVDAVVPVLRSGVSNDSLRGRVVTGVAVSRSGAASSHRVRVISESSAGSAISTTNSSYHTGGGYFEELSAEHTVSATAEQVRVRFLQEMDETSKHLDELYLMVGSLNDAVRRDQFPPTWWNVRPHLEQGQPLLLHGDRRADCQIVIESQRPYTTFDAARVASGSADADATDAPLDLVAHGVLWRMCEGVGEQQMAAQHYRKHKMLQAQHLALWNDGRGFELPHVNNRISSRVGR